MGRKSARFVLARTTVFVSIRCGNAPPRIERPTAGEGGMLEVDGIPPGEAAISVEVTGEGSGRVDTTLVAGENRLTMRLG